MASKIRLFHAEAASSAVSRVRLVQARVASAGTPTQPRVRLLHAEARSTVAGSKVRVLHAEVVAEVASTLKVWDGTRVRDGYMVAWANGNFAYALPPSG